MTGIVLAHGSARDAVERHKPTWLATFEQVIIISPSDDYLEGSIPLGLSAKNGRGQLERMMFAAVMASRFERAAVLEYDTVFFGVEFGNHFPTSGNLACSVDFKNDDANFAASIYGHSPWMATGEDWWKIATAGADAQLGVPDRWLALACQRAGIKVEGMVWGFSNDAPWGFEILTSAREALRNGARIFHGVKSFPSFLFLEADAEIQKVIPSDIDDW